MRTVCAMSCSKEQTREVDMSKGIFTGEFWYGASMAPYAKSQDWPMADWDNDLANMKKLGFRVARIFVPWDRIERREGELDFSRQDRFVELAAKHGIGVIMNVGGVFNSLQGIYPPQWLVRKYDVTPPCENNQQVINTGPRRYVCLDDPLYRSRALDFIATAVRRYAQHEAVVGWMSWNEPSLRQCYCRHTVQAFQLWLAELYEHDIARLNDVWGTEFPLSYEDWDEIDPPQGAGFRAGGLNAWRDWVNFTQHRLSSAMQAVYDCIKQNDPRNLPVTCNICASHAYSGTFGSTFGSNVRISDVAQSMDITGYSYYTVAHGENTDALHKALYADSFRWTSRDPLRRTLVLETEAGPNYFMITPAQRELNNWLAIGHNAKSIVLWNYRCRFSDNQVGNFNLMGWDGSPTARALRHAELASQLNRHADLINTSCTKAQAAVLASEELSVLLQCTYTSGPELTKQWASVSQSRLGAFKLLWDMNIAFDGINDANLDQLSQYRLLLLPMIENMTPAIAAKLRAYVEQGGTIIAECPFAFKDGDNLMHGYAPIYGLDEVFGARTVDREGVETGLPIHYADGATAPVQFLWHHFKLTTAKPLATYADGRIAICANDFGKGHAIMAGTELFRQYFANPQAAATAFLQQEVLASGAKPNLELLLDGEPALGAKLEVCRLAGELGEMLIILNHNDDEKQFVVKDNDAGEGWVDMRDDQPVVLAGQHTLPPLGVLPLARYRK